MRTYCSWKNKLESFMISFFRFASTATRSPISHGVEAFIFANTPPSWATGSTACLDQLGSSSATCKYTHHFLQRAPRWALARPQAHAYPHHSLQCNTNNPAMHSCSFTSWATGSAACPFVQHHSPSQAGLQLGYIPDHAYFKSGS